MVLYMNVKWQNFQLFSQKDQLSLYLLPSDHTKLHAKFVCLKCKYLREYWIKHVFHLWFFFRSSLMLCTILADVVVKIKEIWKGMILQLLETERGHSMLIKSKTSSLKNTKQMMLKVKGGCMKLKVIWCPPSSTPCSTEW